MKKIPNSYIDTIYSTFLQSREEKYPQNEFDREENDNDSLAALLVCSSELEPENLQGPSIPKHNSKAEEQSNSVISILDDGNNKLFYFITPN